MESQPQNPEFRNNPENFQPWGYEIKDLKSLAVTNPAYQMTK